jgi:hypothetical protein
MQVIRKFRLTDYLVALLLLCFIVACDGDTPNPNAPTISSFTASPTTINQGETSTLTWTLSGEPATSVTINNGVTIPIGSRSVSVSPTTTTTYTLTATNAAGSNTKTVTVTVRPSNPGAPTIDSFTATPSTINQGGSSTLTWTLSGPAATSVTIDNGVTVPAGSNRVNVSPAATTTYKLTATNAAGSNTKTVTVNVTSNPNICNGGQAITLGSVTQGAINFEDKVNYYKVTTDATGVSEIILSSIPTGLNLDITIYNANEVEIERDSYVPPGDSARFLILSAASTFCIRVQRSSGTPSTSPYELRVNLDTSDTNELNNSFDTSTTLTLGETIKGDIYGQDDVDFFKFTTTQTGVAEVTLSSIPQDINLDITLYDSSKVLIVRDSYVPPGDSARFFHLSGPGTFYLEVKRSSGSLTTTPYDLLVTLETSDTNELNNSFDTATVVPVGAVETGAIYGADDVDFFRVDVAAAGTTQVLLSSVPTGLNLDITIFDNQRVQIERDSYVPPGDSATLNLTATSATTYYIRIQESSGTPTPNLYTLSVSDITVP